jgi:serpin B
MLPEEGATTDDLIKEVAQSSVLNNRGWCGTGGDVFQGYEVDLKLPRFETASDTDELDVKNGLVGLMQKMGIKLAFDSDFAEIPNMCEDRNLYISMMRQKAKIKVNEEGSEAAAVTVAGVNDLTTAVGPQEYPKATFHANRPFVYVISEASSGVILFVGKFTGI